MMPIREPVSRSFKTMLQQLAFASRFALRLLRPIRPRSRNRWFLPQADIYDLLLGPYATQLLYVAAALSIADRLDDTARSTDELAAECSCRPRELYRVLRALAGLGVFRELPGRRFANNRASAYLRTDTPGSLRDAAIYMGCEWHWAPMGRLIDRVRDGQPSFVHAHGARFYDYLATHPEASTVFNASMTAFSVQSHSLAARAYGFPGVSVLVDIGGGHGALMESILADQVDMRGIIFDLPHVVAGATMRLHHSDLVTRASVVGGSFLEAIPPGGDGYMLSMILPDYEDADVLKIFSNVRKVIPRTGKLIVLDMLISDSNRPSYAALGDVELLVNTYGHMRTTEEFADLFAASGFRLHRVVSSVAPVSVLEAVPA